MRRLLIAIALSLITSCHLSQTPSDNSVKISPIPEIPTPEVTENIEEKIDGIPRTLKINMTLTSPDDLRIKPGELVKAGQTLSDRVSEKRSLLEKKKLLEISLEQVSRKIPEPLKPLSLPNMPRLPEANFSKEEAVIKKAEMSLFEKGEIVKKQKKLIAALDGLEKGDIERDAIMHEQGKLAIFELKYLQSKVNLESALASLNSAKADRKYEEYKHSLEQQKRLLELQRQELSYQEANSKYIENLRQQEFRKASINTQIATVEEKLGSLVAVTSPFDGKIRKINYESQNNNYILATATLDTTSRGTEEATTMSEFIPRMPEIVAQISYGKF